MFLSFDDRPSDSPFVEKVWRSNSNLGGGRFLSVASCHFEIAVTRFRGNTFLTLRGPETKVSAADCPAGGDWLGIRFKLGAFMPHLPPGRLADRNDVTLPDAVANRSFWLDGSAWDYPDFENAEAFVQRLVRKGILVRDSAIDSSLSTRTAQRHFLRSTGLTQSTIRQIEQARYATNLLKQGVSILDTVHEAGYFDQAHLTRSLQRRIGQTPVQIAQGKQQLSFLYKTKPLAGVYAAARGYEQHSNDICFAQAASR